VNPKENRRNIMSIIGGSWKETEEEQERKYGGTFSGKYKDTSLEDHEYNTMRKSEDSTAEDRLRGHEGRRMFKD
jgi:hypothetical protein